MDIHQVNQEPADAPERERNPADPPEPRGNPEPSRERVEQAEEQLDQVSGN
jgi:hypothetical protein